jgi:hypothetical protein
MLAKDKNKTKRITLWLQEKVFEKIKKLLKHPFF